MDSKIVVNGTGSVSFVGREAVDIYRLMVLASSLRMELKGLKMTRGLAASTIVKRTLGLKGSKAKLLEQLEALIEQRKQEVPVEKEG